MSVRLEYTPFRGTAQEAFWEACGWRRHGTEWFRDLPDDHPNIYPALMGPAQIGKTQIGAAATILNALHYPAEYIILAPTYQNHVLMTTRPKYESFLNSLHQQSIANREPSPVVLTADKKIFHETKKQVELRAGDRGNEYSILHFRSTEDENNLYGPTLGGFHADEAGLMPGSVRNVVQDRVGVGARIGVYTFTPKGSRRHWTNFVFGPQYRRARELLERGEAGVGEHPLYPVFTMRAEDNPILRKEVLRDRAERSTQDKKAWQEYHGDWLDEGGLIFETFDSAVHVRPMGDHRLIRYAAGVDFGSTAPTAMIVAGEDVSGRTWFTHEFYEPRCSEGRLLRACYGLMEMYPGIHFFCDPSGKDERKFLRMHGIPAQAAENSIDRGVSRIWELLAVQGTEPGMYVTPDCVNTISGFESWSLKASSSFGGVVKYEDVEPHFHEMDVVRYSALGLQRIWQPAEVLWEKVNAAR